MIRTPQLSRLLLWGVAVAMLAAPLALRAAPPLKNLQVLDTQDRGEVMKTMKDWNKALGMKCTACHASIRDADVDDPPDTEPGRLKKVTREMVQLTEAISATLKEKKLDYKVSCFSCHRGAAKVPSEP